MAFVHGEYRRTRQHSVVIYRGEHQGRRPTVTHAKNDTSFLDRGLYVEAATQTRGHRCLAQYVVTLCHKSQHDVSVHVILYSDDNAIGQSPSQGLDGLGGCPQKVLPVAENQGTVDLVSLHEELACL